MFDFFKSAEPTQQASAQDESTPPAGQEPQGQQAQQQGSTSNEGQSTPPNPLDIYGKIFENNPDADSNSAPPSLSLDSNVLSDVTKQLDFTKSLDAEMMQRLQSGDLSSLPDVLNQVARQAYSTAMQHNSALVDKFVSQRAEYDAGRIAPTVKSALTESKLSSTMEGMDFPGMKQQLTEVASKLAKAYPDASPDWIAEQAQSYTRDSAMRALGINPEQIQQLQSQEQQQKTAADTDWSTYFDK